MSGLRQQGRQSGLGDAVRQGHAQPSPVASRSTLDAGFGLIDHGEDALCFLKQHGSRPSEAGAPCGPFEQLHAQSILKILDDP